MFRFSAVALVFALAGCESVLGADFNKPAATASEQSADGGPEGPGSPENPPPTTDGGNTTPCANPPACAPQALKPSNGDAFGSLPPTGTKLTVPETASFNTATDCNAASILGDCTPIIQTEGPAVCVCRSGSIAIQNLNVRGARALALLVNGDVAISGVLDIAATRTTGGPGAEPAPQALANSGLFVHGSADLVPLRGGIAAIGGSAGGGALQISAGGSIAIAPMGSIQAGGGGGKGRTYTGADGGSGGAILLEAPIVKIEGFLLANGGGGGGGGDREVEGDDGQDARDALLAQAAGGAGEDGKGCSLNGYTAGGDGGHGAIEGMARTTGQAADSRSCIPNKYVEAGGDGGGVGRIRINATTAANIQTASSARVSPKASTGIAIIQ